MITLTIDEAKQISKTFSDLCIRVGAAGLCGGINCQHCELQAAMVLLNKKVEEAE